MEAKYLTKEKEVVEVQLNNCDEGIVRMVADRLSRDKKVGFAAVTLDHPLTSNPVLRVKASSAKESVEKALEKVLEEIEAAQKKARALE